LCSLFIGLPGFLDDFEATRNFLQLNPQFFRLGFQAAVL